MAVKKTKFQIVTPERVVLKDEITQITVPTAEGEITVLPDHIPLVASLKPGVIEVKNADGTISIISVSGGFIEVTRDKIVILANTAEHAEEIDLARAEEARKRAEEVMKSVKRYDQEHFASVSAAIAKELARTKAVKRWKKIKNINQ